MASPPGPRFTPLALFLQAASLCIVAVVGTAMVTRGASAQAQNRATAGARAANGREGALAVLTGDAGGLLDTDASSGAGDGGAASVSTGAGTAAGDAPVRAIDRLARDAGDPLDYAVEQTAEDLPPGLSAEERRAMGEGPVPIHREGPFRSALAHPHFGEPARVRVGLVLNSVRNYDITRGAFDADFFISLMSDRGMPPINLTFPNGNVSSSYTLVDTPTLKVYRYSVSLVSPVDLRAYPFDTQELSIQVEDQRVGVDQVIFEADQSRTALDEDFTVAGWGVAYLGARAYRHLYPARFDRDDLYVSRYRFSVGLDRFNTSAAFNVFVPAIVIILISLTGLWMPFSHVDVRSNAGAPMLAAAVLFHFSLKQSLPATGYLTRADKLMLGVYIALLLNMFSTWAFFIVPAERHETVFRWGRFWIPPITLVVMLISMFV
jgi:hypothetical protein